MSLATALQGVVAIALIVAYVIVTVTGHDGTALIAALGGQLSGAGIERAVKQAKKVGGK